MKTLFFVFVSVTAIGQTFTNTKNESFDYLIRNQENRIVVNPSTLSKSSEYKLECEGCEITTVDKYNTPLPKNHFIVTTNKTDYSRIAKLILSQDGQKQLEKEFSISNMPVGSLTLNGQEIREEKIRLEPNKPVFLCVVDPIVHSVKTDYQVTAWQLTYEDQKFEGSGSEVPNEVIKRILEGAKVNSSEFVLIYDLLGADSIKRKRTTQIQFEI